MSGRSCDAEDRETTDAQTGPMPGSGNAAPSGESSDSVESAVGPAMAPRRPEAASSLLWHACWTVPLHLVLPVGLWWLIRNNPIAAAWAFAGVHLGVPVLLLITVRWWWDRVADLVLLLLINHLTTFSVLAFLPW